MASLPSLWFYVSKSWHAVCGTLLLYKLFLPRTWLSFTLSLHSFINTTARLECIHARLPYPCRCHYLPWLRHTLLKISRFTPVSNLHVSVSECSRRGFNDSDSAFQKRVERPDPINTDHHLEGMAHDWARAIFSGFILANTVELRYETTQQRTGCTHFFFLVGCILRDIWPVTQDWRQTAEPLWMITGCDAWHWRSAKLPHRCRTTRL